MAKREIDWSAAVDVDASTMPASLAKAYDGLRTAMADTRKAKDAFQSAFNKAKPVAKGSERIFSYNFGKLRIVNATASATHTKASGAKGFADL